MDIGSFLIFFIKEIYYFWLWTPRCKLKDPRLELGRNSYLQGTSKDGLPHAPVKVMERSAHSNRFIYKKL